MNEFEREEWAIFQALEGEETSNPPEGTEILPPPLSEWRICWSALTYALPVREPSSQLKEAVFARIRAESSLQAIRAGDIQWQPHPVPGVEIAPLHIDLAQRRMVALFRAQANVYYPRHRHAGVEEIYMLKGDLIIDTEVFGPGDFLLSFPGSEHPHATQHGCLCLVRASLDDEFIEALATHLS